MENLKHTKGEWTATMDDVYSLEYGLIGNIICDAPKSNKSYENWEANAKLISAAPDLLESLIWAKEQFKILQDKGLYPEHLLQENGGNGIMPIVNAINKATK